MIRASGFFSDQDKIRIREAVAAAEKTTAGEIVPAVATCSGRYQRAEDIAGLWMAGIALALLWWFGLPSAMPGKWTEAAATVSWWGLLLALGVLLLGFLLGAILASRLAWLRRLFVHRREMVLAVEEKAAQVFFQADIRATRARTGILIYLSLVERIVRVTGDSAISAKLSDRDWQEVCDLILTDLRRGQAADGLVAGIRRCGEILAKHFPIQLDDVNELPNDLRIMD